jgi:hypothetical protein
MTLDERLIGEGLRDDVYGKMSGAAARPGMTDVQVAIVPDVQLQRQQLRRQPFPHAHHTLAW